ncbi:MAG: hypothetical protein WBW61_08995 [Rhodanobacteraceae bacterium]
MDPRFRESDVNVMGSRLGDTASIVRTAVGESRDPVLQQRIKKLDCLCRNEEFDYSEFPCGCIWVSPACQQENFLAICTCYRLFPVAGSVVAKAVAGSPPDHEVHSDEFATVWKDLE